MHSRRNTRWPASGSCAELVPVDAARATTAVAPIFITRLLIRLLPFSSDGVAPRKVSAQSWGLPRDRVWPARIGGSRCAKGKRHGVSNGGRRLQCQRPKVTISLAGPDADRAMVPGKREFMPALTL